MKRKKSDRAGGDVEKNGVLQAFGEKSGRIVEKFDRRGKKIFFWRLVCIKGKCRDREAAKSASALDLNGKEKTNPSRGAAQTSPRKAIGKK